MHRDFGFPAVCHPAWADSREQFEERSWDRLETALMRSWLRPGDGMIDVGANQGLYTFAAAERVGAQGAVLAIDADAFVVERLQEAVDLLATRQVTVVQAAVARESGWATFYVYPGHAKTGEQSLRPLGATLPWMVERRVRSLPMGEALTVLGRPPSVVKVDIEGAEVEALSTVPADLLGPEGPLWIVELNPRTLQEFGCGPDDLMDRLPAASFDRWILPKAPTGSEVARLHPYQKGEQFRILYNVIAIPRGRRADARRHSIRAWIGGQART